jgi:hypothetical protein
MDMRFGTWNVRIMHRAGSLRTVAEEGVLRRIFGPKRDDVTGAWRKLHND